MKIWCVEDDNSIRDIEVYTLSQTGFEAEGFPDGEAFFSAMKSSKPDLVILDVMLPGEDGVEILKHLRSGADTSSIPVIMATAKGMEYDKIKTLDLGADDYLVKPFGMMGDGFAGEGCFKALQAQRSDNTLTVSGISHEFLKENVEINGVKTELTYKEFEILRLFLSHPGMVFTRERLFSDVWGENYIGETRTVDMHIKTLRQKLGEHGDMIETVRSVGYRLGVKAK